jgi:hypothetical protein
MAELPVLAEIPDAAADRVAALPGGHWATAVSTAIDLYRDMEHDRALPDPPGPVLGLEGSPDGKRLLAAPQQYDLEAEAWLPAPPLPRGWHATAAAGDAVALELDRSRTPPADGNEERLDVAGETIWRGTRAERIGALAVHGDWIGAATEHVLVLDREGRELAQLTEQSMAVRRLAFSAGGAHLAAAATDGRVALWSTAGWRLEKLLHHGEDVHGLALDPDHPRLATGGNDGRVVLWGLDGERLGSTEIGSGIADLAFTADGAQLLVARDAPATGVVVLGIPL